MDRRKTRRTWLLALAWAATFVAALAIDTTSATLVRDHVSSSLAVRRVLRSVWYLGHIGTCAAIGVILCVVHAHRWRAGLVFWASGLTAGALYALVKWCVGRTRPFKGVDAFELQPFVGGIRALFIGMPNSTFPSGHATLVFAMAACLHRFYPRIGWLFYTLASCVAVARVLRGAHYLSDVVAGAGVGLISAWLVLEVARNSGFIPPADAKPKANLIDPSAALRGR